MVHVLAHGLLMEITEAMVYFSLGVVSTLMVTYSVKKTSRVK